MTCLYVPVEVCAACFHGLHADCEGQGCYCDCLLDEPPCDIHDETDWCHACGGCPECGNCHCDERDSDDDDY